MTIFKKIIAIAAGTAAISAMAVAASAHNHTATVSCDEKDYQYYKSEGYELKTFYDYGTTTIFDNARIYAKASTTTNGYVYAFIKYADFRTEQFKTSSKSSYGDTAYVNYNPFGVDMLQPLSYANAYGDGEDFYLRVTY